MCVCQFLSTSKRSQWQEKCSQNANIWSQSGALSFSGSFCLSDKRMQHNFAWITIIPFIVKWMLEFELLSLKT